MNQQKNADYRHIAQRVLGIMQEQRQLRRSATQCEAVELAEEKPSMFFGLTLRLFSQRA
jgi:hypothetical protein